MSHARSTEAEALTREEIEIMREDLIEAGGWLPDGRARLSVLCDMAIRSLGGPSSRDLWEAANVFRQSFHYDPGHSDLDRDQPITITVTLGSWRDLNWALNSLDATTSPIEKEKP